MGSVVVVRVSSSGEQLNTNKSKNAKNGLFNSDRLISCKFNLIYDTNKGKSSPTSLVACFILTEDDMPVV
jgi:hypothetical protein